MADVYDRERLVEAVRGFAPDVVINELTDMPSRAEDIDTNVNARMRTEGHHTMLEAAAAAKYVVQSIAVPLSGAAGEALAELERTSLAAGGVVLRYGIFWGPGTYSGDERPEGVPSVHVDEAARVTVEALEWPSGVYDVLD